MRVNDPHLSVVEIISNPQCISFCVQLNLNYTVLFFTHVGGHIMIWLVKLNGKKLQLRILFKRKLNSNTFFISFSMCCCLTGHQPLTYAATLIIYTSLFCVPGTDVWTAYLEQLFGLLLESWTLSVSIRDKNSLQISQRHGSGRES